MKKLFLLAAAAVAMASCCNKTDNQSADTTQIERVMKYQSATFPLEAELPWETPAPGVRRQVMGYNDDIMLVKLWWDEAGADGGGTHSHPHTQSSIIISGVFDITIDGVTQRLKAGDGFYAAPNLVHGAICVEPGQMIDCFSPIRETFVPKAE